MDRKEIEELRERVSCVAVLETAGFAIDAKESTRRAVKYRRASEIVILTHEGQGWFDPLGDAKGDVFALVSHLESVGFPQALEHVASLSGFRSASPVWQTGPKKVAIVPVFQRWLARSSPAPASGVWRYLNRDRCLPDDILRQAIRQNLLREGPSDSMWAAHTDDTGTVTGWEERGPDWRGFSSGGTKVLFRFGPAAGLRICVTEAAIDALSLAAIEGLRDGTIYLSTGGGWSPNTETSLRHLLRQPSAQLIAATDANSQGETFADRLRALTDELDRDWLRLRPTADDWNEVLKQRGG